VSPPRRHSAPAIGCRLALGQDHHQLRGIPGEVAEEGQRQRRRVAVFGEGLQIEAVHRGEVGLGRFVAVHDAERRCRLRATLARSWRMFLRCLWSIAARKLVEVSASPASLRQWYCTSMRNSQSSASNAVLVGSVVEIDVRRRQPGLPGSRSPPAGVARSGVAREQARPGHGRVGHRASHFG
jgi:hypothetical protein